MDLAAYGAAGYIGPAALPVLLHFLEMHFRALRSVWGDKSASQDVPRFERRFPSAARFMGLEAVQQYDSLFDEIVNDPGSDSD